MYDLIIFVENQIDLLNHRIMDWSACDAPERFSKIPELENELAHFVDILEVLKGVDGSYD